MTLVEPTLFSLARAAVITAAAFVLLLAAGPEVQSWPRKFRAIIIWVAMASLLAPGFAVAFHLYKSVMSDPKWLEWTYCNLVHARCLPAALLVLWLFQPAMSHEALHSMQLGRSTWLRRRLCEARAWGNGLPFACALIFLLAFQEFEIAATWNMRTWSVALFDAQAGGLALSESMRLVLLPLLIQAAVIAFLYSMRRRDFLPAMEISRHRNRSLWILFPMGMGFVCFALFPVVLFAGRVPQVTDASQLAFTPWREISNSLIIASVATLTAWLAAGWIEARRGLRFLLAAPGLLGPLLVGLILLAVMQIPPLHLLRDTVFPALFGLALVLLPYALMLRFGIEKTQDPVALHIASISGARRAKWVIDGWPRLCALLLLVCFGFGDFTINTLLAPPQFTSASTRLLNLLHYGQSSALVTMFTLAFAVPFGAALLTASLGRLYARRCVR